MEESVRQLADGPPFQNTLALWSVLARKKGTDWRDIESYISFVDFLRKSNINLLEAPYGHPLARSLDLREPTYTVKVDSVLIDVLRNYFV